MRKPVLVAVALVVLLAACGKPKTSNVTLGGTSASPGASGSAAPGSTEAPKKSSAPGSTKAPTTTKAGSASGATPKPAGQGGVNTPKDGTYVYRLDGTSDSAQTGHQTFSNKTATGKISHSRNLYSTQSSSSEQSGSSTTKVEWDPTQLLLVSIHIEQGSLQFDCTYNPKPVIAHIPTKAEKFPQQKLAGSGNACDGTLDIQVFDKENAKDATGKSWSTWRIEVKTTNKISYNGAPITVTSDQMRWFAPDLGVEVKEVTDQQNKSAFGTGSSHLTTLLKSHP